jgi:subtilisin-like proprotein convertase family protein
MTSSTHPTTDPTTDRYRLSDRRRFRQSLTALTGAAVLAAGAAVALASPASAASADHANPSPVDLRNQYYSPASGASITVTDDAPASLYPSPLTVTGVQGVVTDVDVRLSQITHGFPDDMDVMVVGPNGQKVILMSDAGGSSDLAATTLTLDDEAASGLPASAQISAGSFNATNDNSDQQTDPDTFPAPAPGASDAGSLLSAFDGFNPNGTWQLYVVDDDFGIAGLIGGWSLNLTTTDGTSPYPATVQVSGATGTVTDVDVALHGFTHTFADDLDVMLVGPGGQRAMVMSDAGGSDDVQDRELVLDDESDRALPDDVAFSSGSYRPGDFEADDAFPAPAPDIAGISSSLSVFDGTGPNGTWQLFIVDDADVDQGALEGGWSIHVTTTDPAPPAGTTPVTTPSTSPAADISHPKVTGTAPKAGATGVKRGVTVKATLSEKVRKATITGSTVKLRRPGSTKAVAATVSYNATTRTISIDPALRLKPGTKYTVVVTTAVKDLAGNALDQKPARTGLQNARWSFTTR